MAYNVTKKDRRTAAANDLAQKLKFENVLQKATIPYFDKISNDFYQNYLASSYIINAGIYSDQLNKILTDNYNKVALQFSQQIRASLGQPTDKVQENDVNQRIAISLALLGSTFINTSVVQMNVTTNKDLHASIADVIAVATAAGLTLTHKQKAQQAKFNFDKSVAGRLTTISQDQVQFAAESGKNAEYQSLYNSGAVVGGIDVKKSTRTKTWIAILDMHTRQAHVIADGQVVTGNQPFIVGGQQLKYPRDTSLGATTENVINCRCNAVYSIQVM